MAEERTIARPYAQALFELASKQGDLKGWSATLAALTGVAAHERVKALFGNPQITKDQLAQLVIDTCGAKLTEAGKNFVKIVVQNGRLALVPAIRDLYDQLRAQAEATLNAEVTSAFPLNKEQEQQISSALKKRFSRDVTLTSRVDESLVGGVVVRAGDYVIDGSVIGHLDRLGNALTV